MKRLALIALASMCFSSPAFAYYFEHTFGQDPYNIGTGYSGNYEFRQTVGQWPDFGLYDHVEGVGGSSDPVSGFVYRLNDGDSPISLTSIYANFDFYVSTTSNLDHDVPFASIARLSIHSSIAPTTVFAYNQTISHPLNSTSQIQVSWSNTYSFVPDAEYVIELDFFPGFYPYSPYPHNTYSHYDYLKAIDVDWDAIFMKSVSCRWEGLMSLDFAHHPVPEPAIALLLGIGFAMVLILRSCKLRSCKMKV